MFKVQVFVPELHVPMVEQSPPSLEIVNGPVGPVGATTSNEPVKTLFVSSVSSTVLSGSIVKV